MLAREVLYTRSDGETIKRKWRSIILCMAVASLEKIDKSVLLLRRKLHLTANGEFDSKDLGVGAVVDHWVVVAQWTNKLALINKKLDIFAKVFAVNTLHYSNAAFLCIHELAQVTCESTVPILKPIAHVHQSIIFERGQPQRVHLPRPIYTLEQLDQIEAIAAKYRFFLSNFSPKLGTDIVEIGGKRFLVDPLSDFPVEIENYVR